MIDRCLAKDPNERYPDLANLAHALAAYAGPDGWELANAVSRMLRMAPAPRPQPSARLIAGEFRLLDAQFMTEHLAQFGAQEIERPEYHRRLAEALTVEADFQRLAVRGGAAALQVINQAS